MRWTAGSRKGRASWKEGVEEGRFIAVGPLAMEMGIGDVDVVCVFYGAMAPFVLRAVGDSGGILML